jgi:voltage-gated potassium channel
MKPRNIRNAYIALGLLLGLISIGTGGYILIEGMTFTEGFYMTIITVGTVGFREVRELSATGMYFTAFLIIVSFGIFGYAVTTLIQYVSDGTFRKIYTFRRVKRKIQHLKNHVVVCGYGRNGRQAVTELLEHNVPIIIVESNEQIMENVQANPNLFYVQGDATRDEVLNNCHLSSAKALITTLPVDAHNLFVVLTAREINPKMAIISRASDEHSDVKLKRAGATNVIMPDRIGGQRMAKMVVQPDIVEFLEFMMLQSMESVALEEVFCTEISDRFNGVPLREFDRQNDSGANIIGMKRSDKSIVINPLPELILTPQDKIFALGTRTQVQRLRVLLNSGDYGGGY